ncbi:LMBR1-like membrane protein [Carpediemonas membranifera]|uniref:LMBR1-like membrane protein n=1 Tax=Carpediemonas membranifera TaxID=201153 RepID=A0A8J6AU92_9EUKA|nr:LMBR1-like membrane protein [Carpediemonas membranifera]|eukprot:KAG9394318.1 LMBR1-like membrane protein [Carpediemonas membranifera]
MSSTVGAIFAAFFTVTGIVASLSFSLWYLIAFQHPEDKFRAWIPKSVIVTSMFMALFTIFLLPIDISFADFDLFPFLFVWVAVAAVDVILLLFVLPFAIIYYESLDTKPNIIKQLLKSVLAATVVLAIFAAVTVVTWLVFGEAHIPVQTYSSDLVAYSTFTAADLTTLTLNHSVSDATVRLNLLLHLHVIAFASVVGMVLFIIFASVGAVAIPMDLISEWRYRPRPFSNDRVAQFRIVFRSRAMMLKEIAQKHSDDMRERREETVNGNKKRKLTRAERKLPVRVQEASRQLEKEYEYVQISTGAKRYLPLLYWGKLALAVVLLCLSVVWMVHLVLFMLPADPLHPGLNLIFRSTEDFLPFLGTALYSVFGVYLLACTVKGVTRLGTRILLFANIHPLEKHQSYCNTLMFNAMVMLLISLALVRFLCTSFSVYTRATSANVLFNGIFDNISYVRHAFPWAYFAMPFISVVSVILLLIFPHKNELVDRLLQRDLTKAIGTATKGRKGERFIDSIKDVRKLRLGKPRQRGADDNV